jgi:hypothetical protein
VIVIVVCRFVSVMAVIVITALKMVLQLVRALRVRVVRHGNQGSAQKTGAALRSPMEFGAPGRN